MPVVLATQEPTAQSLPRANTRAAGSFPSDQYVHIQGLPVFREHRTKDNDGNPLVFNAAALDKLAKQCNRRIQESGDYAAIIVGHTSDKADPIQRHPEVIGYAGPFRLGVLGEQGPRPVYCILADFWIRKDKLDVYHAHPRRSAELWVQGNQSFLDPIALLGGDPRGSILASPPKSAPRAATVRISPTTRAMARDSSTRCGWQPPVLKYSMAAMSAGTILGNVSPLSAGVMGKRKQGGTGPGKTRAIKMAAGTSRPKGQVMPIFDNKIEEFLKPGISRATPADSAATKIDLIDFHKNHLTPTERSILNMTVDGLPNDQIASRLGLKNGGSVHRIREGMLSKWDEMQGGSGGNLNVPIARAPHPTNIKGFQQAGEDKPAGEGEEPMQYAADGSPESDQQAGTAAAGAATSPLKT